MFRPTTKPTHKFVGRIPELNYYLVREIATDHLELWTASKGVQLQSIKLGGVELEFVRTVHKAARVVDNEFNRTNCLNDIGRIFVDSFPNHAYVKDL